MLVNQISLKLNKATETLPKRKLQRLLLKLVKPKFLHLSAQWGAEDLKSIGN